MKDTIIYFSILEVKLGYLKQYLPKNIFSHDMFLPRKKSTERDLSLNQFSSLGKVTVLNIAFVYKLII